MTTSYHVKDGHTLGYIDSRQPAYFCPLAGKPQLGGHDWQNGPAHLGRLNNLQPATLADFDFFRVSAKGHIL